MLPLQAQLMIAAAGCLLLGGYGIWADRRRLRRSAWDDVGLVPWPLVQMLSLIAPFCLALIAWRV